MDKKERNERLDAMVKAFKLAKKSEHTFLCDRIYWLHRLGEISRTTRRDCVQLIQRAIYPHETYESWLAEHEDDTAWYHRPMQMHRARRAWLDALIAACEEAKT